MTTYRNSATCTFLLLLMLAFVGCGNGDGDRGVMTPEVVAPAGDDGAQAYEKGGDPVLVKIINGTVFECLSATIGPDGGVVTGTPPSYAQYGPCIFFLGVPPGALSEEVEVRLLVEQADESNDNLRVWLKTWPEITENGPIIFQEDVYFAVTYRPWEFISYPDFQVDGYRITENSQGEVVDAEQLLQEDPYPTSSQTCTFWMTSESTKGDQRDRFYDIIDRP